MAYPLQRYREGHYVFTRFSASGSSIPEIRHGLKIMEDVLRASITVAIGPIQQKTAQPAAPDAAAAAPPAAPPAPTPSDAASTPAPADGPQE
jgi:ribosomal protein S6